MLLCRNVFWYLGCTGLLFGQVAFIFWVDNLLCPRQENWDPLTVGYRNPPRVTNLPLPDPRPSTPVYKKDSKKKSLFN